MTLVTQGYGDGHSLTTQGYGAGGLVKYLFKNFILHITRLSLKTLSIDKEYSAPLHIDEILEANVYLND